MILYFSTTGSTKLMAEKIAEELGDEFLDLLETALAYAKLYYSRCYLETLENMKAAQRFCEKNGFERIYEPLGETGHFECDVRYIKNL